MAAAPAPVAVRPPPTPAGPRRLWLAARDPHWLYAAWDLTAAELADFESRAVDGHLTLRVHERAVGPTPLLEVALAAGATSWFVHVGRAATPYLAELGCAEPDRGWHTILASDVAETPPEAPTAPAPAAVQFATIPVDIPFAVILARVAEAARVDRPLAQKIEVLRQEGFDALPAPDTVRASAWTPEQERALAEVLRVDDSRRVWVSSLDVTALVAGGLGLASEHRAGAPPAAPAAPAAPAVPTSPAAPFSVQPGGVSSPAGGAAERAGRRGFWFNVNAELVIYGATEPDARVTIAGRTVRLRPDGSFSLRFALPDGRYELPVLAVSPAGDEGRSAKLEFSRRTDYEGEVGAHPQDPSLRPPRPEALTSQGSIVST